MWFILLVDRQRLQVFASNRDILGAFLGAFRNAAFQPCWEGREMALTDTAVRLAKPESKDRKLADEKGLYLLVTARGSKLWRWKTSPKLPRGRN